MATSKNDETISRIIRSNNGIKRSTKGTIQDFLDLQRDFFKNISTHYDNLATIQQVTDILFNDEKKQSLDEFKTFDKVQLVVCGYNSAGKTSFLHAFLKCGAFLPTGDGAVTARIVKFSYAPPDQACLLQHSSVESTFTEQQPAKLLELSSYFGTNITNRRANTKALKEAINKHLERPAYGVTSPEFAEWASRLIEIRIPSQVLELEIDVYDTPGFLGHDAPFLIKNLQTLVKIARPSLLFLYDNPSFADDTLSCFRALKASLRHLEATGVFFLNTKADISTILRDAEIDETDCELEQKELNDLLLNVRERRYQLLIKVESVRNEMPDASLCPTLDKCDCFDVFSVERSEHRMTQAMQRGAIDRIVQFAAEHDLQQTRYVSRIMLDAIDAFFDFILISNRRSPEEWNRLQVEALKWSDEFFEQYRTKIDTMTENLKVGVLQKFSERRRDIEKNAFITYEKGWHIPYTPTQLVCKIIPGYYKEDHKLFVQAINSVINSAVEEEVITPVLKEVVSKVKSETKQTANEGSTVTLLAKNELLCAAFGEVLTNIVGSVNLPIDYDYATEIAGEILVLLYSPINVPLMTLGNLLGTVFGIAPHGLDNKEQRQRMAIKHYLVDVEHHLSNINERMKPNLHKWIDDNHKQFKQKVKSYHKIVQKTMAHRKKAHILSRTFSGRFVRIECRLVANLDLAKHQGKEPIISNEALGHGGFFSVHPASWNMEQELVAKVPRDPVRYPDVGYLEAHFHRTVTRLQIGHMVPLRYLFEKDEQQAQATASTEKRQLFILLPRYRTDLRAYLMKNINNITMDRAVQIVLDIARVVAHMHSYELVHRDVKALNILLDDQEQVFLADFGTCQHGTENTTVIGSPPFPPELFSDHQFSYDGAAFDVHSLGTLMYVVAPKRSYVQPIQSVTEADVKSLDQTVVPDSFRQLILRCVDEDPKKRLTASQVVHELENIANQVANCKPCLVCLDKPRFQRCFPCGHKTMCNTCLIERQRANSMPQCILCRQVFRSTQEDTDLNTFVPPVTRPQ